MLLIRMYLHLEFDKDWFLISLRLIDWKLPSLKRRHKLLPPRNPCRSLKLLVLHLPNRLRRRKSKHLLQLKISSSRQSPSKRKLSNSSLNLRRNNLRRLYSKRPLPCFPLSLPLNLPFLLKPLRRLQHRPRLHPSRLSSRLHLLSPPFLHINNSPCNHRHKHLNPRCLFKITCSNSISSHRCINNSPRTSPHILISIQAPSLRPSRRRCNSSISRNSNHHFIRGLGAMEATTGSQNRASSMHQHRLRARPRKRPMAPLHPSASNSATRHRTRTSEASDQTTSGTTMHQE